MPILSTATTVGEFVTQRPSRSRVFQKLGIDFCCGGKRSLAEVCTAKGLDPQSVLQVLLAGEDATGPGREIGVAQMSLTQLCDHIQATHHAYLKQELPRLRPMIAKVVEVHGAHSPWLREVLDIYDAFQAELTQHMMKEDNILFPLIRGLESGQNAAAGHGCGSIANPIRVMEHEHDSAGHALARISQLSSGYTAPPEACNTFRAVLDGLRELELDLHQHIHKENNVLFPRAIALESKVAVTVIPNE